MGSIGGYGAEDAVTVGAVVDREPWYTVFMEVTRCKLKQYNTVGLRSSYLKLPPLRQQIFRASSPILRLFSIAKYAAAKWGLMKAISVESAKMNAVSVLLAKLPSLAC